MWATTASPAMESMGQPASLDRLRELQTTLHAWGRPAWGTPAWLTPVWLNQHDVQSLHTGDMQGIGDEEETFSGTGDVQITSRERTSSAQMSGLNDI